MFHICNKRSRLYRDYSGSRGAIKDSFRVAPNKPTSRKHSSPKVTKWTVLNTVIAHKDCISAALVAFPAVFVIRERAGLPLGTLLISQSSQLTLAGFNIKVLSTSRSLDAGSLSMKLMKWDSS
jgi:hypothetical protein